MTPVLGALPSGRIIPLHISTITAGLLDAENTLNVPLNRAYGVTPSSSFTPVTVT